jgi:hypothetical protein
MEKAGPPPEWHCLTREGKVRLSRLDIKLAMVNPGTEVPGLREDVRNPLEGLFNSMVFRER